MSAWTRPCIGLTALVMGATGCDLSGDFLFPEAIDGVPGVVHLGTLSPVDINDRADVAAATIYHEVGPTGSTAFGGVTFEVVGTGGTICIWVDPETVTWNQSVSPTAPIRQWTFPDNLFDDGDLDIKAGQTAFYSGVPGESVGDFDFRFEDSLGNTVPIDTELCAQVGAEGIDGRAGRGSVDRCTIADTLPGVSYTVLLETWSLPLDDDRLGYGVVVANGDCEAFETAVGVNGDAQGEECIIRGESIVPNQAQGPLAEAAGLPAPSWFGIDEVPAWVGSSEFEDRFCGNTTTPPNLPALCRTERNTVRDAGQTCSWANQPNSNDDDAQRCFCGNQDDTPSAGSN